MPSRNRWAEFLPSASLAAARPSSKLSTSRSVARGSELLAYLIASSFSRAARFLIIIEVGLAAEGEVAETVEIALQTGGRVVALRVWSRVGG